MDCTRNNRDTHDRARCRHSIEYPIVSVSALLQLAEWVRRFRVPTTGGDPCDTMTTERPPFAKAADRAEGPVGDAGRGNTATGTPNPQSDPHPSVSADASGATGGAA